MSFSYPACADHTQPFLSSLLFLLKKTLSFTSLQRNANLIKQWRFIIITFIRITIVYMVTPALYSSSVHKPPKSHGSDRSNRLHFSCYEIASCAADPVIHQRSQFMLASAAPSWPCTVDLHRRITSQLMLHTFYGRKLLNLLTWKTDAGPHWKQSSHFTNNVFIHSHTPNNW